MATGKKQRSYSIDFKMKIFQAIDAGNLSKTEICKKYDFPSLTLSTFLKNRSKIEEENSSGSRKRIREAAYSDIDEVLYRWFLMARQSAIPINGPLMMEKAEKFAKDLGHSEFKATASWLQRFKGRKGIVSKVVSGESAATDTTVVANWKSKLSGLLEGYSPDCIYNVDETGLFYRCLPNRTLTFKGEHYHGGKMSKERLTLLLGANMDGSDKIDPLVIGKSARPRCFRTAGRVPLPYESNSTAWMTGMIWQQWVKSFNRRMIQQNKKVLLFVDNCPGHPMMTGLSNVTIQYLPPQTTSHLQPCDQGIIRCFKRHYRQSLLQQYIMAIERKEDYKPTVLDAMIHIQIAWEKVTATTIANCFRHAGFGHPASGIDVTPEESDMDSVEDLARHVCQLVGVETSNCADIDADVATSGTLSDEDIVTQFQQDAIQQNIQEDEESDDDDEPPPLPSKEAVSDAFQILKRHFQCRDPCKLKDLLALETSTIWSKKQTKLSDFFSTT